MKNILLIEDDLVIHTLVEALLPEGMCLKSCHSLAEATRTLEAGILPDLILIDRQLPDGDGLTICSKIRSDAKLKCVPIIFLSGQGAETDKVTGLYAGADDYVTKPFGPLELRARIETRLRKVAETLTIGSLTLEMQSLRAVRDNEGRRSDVELTRIEFKLLVLMGKAPDRVFTRSELLDRVWAENFELSDRVVDAHISHLRKKITGCGIQISALRGEGYRLSVDSPGKKSPQAA